MYNIKTFNNISNVIFNKLTGDKYAVSADMENYDGALVRSADLQNAEFPKELLAIARAGAGTNNIPIDRCTEEGIVVFNTPGANANAVKELVLCGLLLSCRKIIPGAEWVINAKKSGEENIEKLAEKAKKNFVGPEVAGKKLGVIGLGAIGVLVANAAINGLDMDVLGYDPYLGVNSALKLSPKVRITTDVNNIFRECDYITIHVPLNDETKNTINAKTIAMMKEDVAVLNFARGGLVDPVAIENAVTSGKIRAYVTDFAQDNLIGLEGVTVLPHLGASTPESEENCAAMAAAELDDYLQNGNISNSVNLPACSLPRLGSCRLAVINRNVSNMVGRITAVLGDAGYNIEHMINKGRGQYAYTLIDTDTMISETELAKINAIDGVLRTRVIGK